MMDHLLKTEKKLKKIHDLDWLSLMSGKDSTAPHDDVRRIHDHENGREVISLYVLIGTTTTNVFHNGQKRFIGKICI